jgi:hypothetical protein
MKLVQGSPTGYISYYESRMIVNKNMCLAIDAVVKSYSARGVDEIGFAWARQLTEIYSPRPEVLRRAKWARMSEMQ